MDRDVLIHNKMEADQLYIEELESERDKLSAKVEELSRIIDRFLDKEKKLRQKTRWV